MIVPAYPGSVVPLEIFKLTSLLSLPYRTASGNVASMREPLDRSLWWYWIAANAAKKNGASFKNYHRLSHLFYLC